MASGFAEAFFASVTEFILRTNRAEQRQRQDPTNTDTEQERIAVLRYKRQVSHRLEKIRKRVGVRVLFCASFKLIILAKSASLLKK